MSYDRSYLAALDRADTAVGPLRPKLPVGWSSIGGGDGWCSFDHETHGRIVTMHAATPDAATQSLIGASDLWLVWGLREVLDSIADANPRLAPLREVWRDAHLSSDSPLRRRSRAILRWLPVWRGDFTTRDQNGDPVRALGVLRLTDGTVQLPSPAVDPFPWNLDERGNVVALASAVVRVHGLVRPAIDRSIPGLPALHQIAEDEPER